MKSNLPEGWKEISLGDIAEFQEGYVNPSQKVPSYFGGDIKWLRVADLNNSYVYDTERKLSIEGFKSSGKSALLFNKNTLAISKSGTIGKLGILKDKMCGNRAIINIESNEYSNIKFLFYNLLIRNKELQQLAVGSVQKNLYISNLSTIVLKLPSIVEQNSIVDTISTLDDKIELNNRINENLEKQAQAIFKHWFIDLEFPDENGNPYKSSGGEMIESELGMIPKEWEVKSLDEIAEFLNGIAIAKHKPKTELDETLPAIKIREVRQGFTDDSSDRCLISVDEKYIINDYDMLFAWSGSLLIDTWIGGKAILNQHLFKVTSDEYDQWYYYYWTKYFLDEFIEIAKNKATTMGHINRSHLSDSKVLLPDENTYKQMEGLLKNILNLKMKNKKQNQKLSQLRDTLLPKLMSGELRIPLD